MCPTIAGSTLEQPDAPVPEPPALEPPVPPQTSTPPQPSALAPPAPPQPSAPPRRGIAGSPSSDSLVLTVTGLALVVTAVVALCLPIPWVSTVLTFAFGAGTAALVLGVVGVCCPSRHPTRDLCLGIIAAVGGFLLLVATTAGLAVVGFERLGLG